MSGNLSHSTAVSIEEVKTKTQEIAELLAFAYSDGEFDADNHDYEVADRLILWLEQQTVLSRLKALDEEHPDWSSRVLAAALGVSSSTVRELRGRRGSDDE